MSAISSIGHSIHHAVNNAVRHSNSVNKAANSSNVQKSHKTTASPVRHKDSANLSSEAKSLGKGSSKYANLSPTYLNNISKNYASNSHYYGIVRDMNSQGSHYARNVDPDKLKGNSKSLRAACSPHYGIVGSVPKPNKKASVLKPNKKAEDDKSNFASSVSDTATSGVKGSKAINKALEANDARKVESKGASHTFASNSTNTLSAVKDASALLNSKSSTANRVAAGASLIGDFASIAKNNGLANRTKLSGGVAAGAYVLSDAIATVSSAKDLVTAKNGKETENALKSLATNAGNLAFSSGTTVETGAKFIEKIGSAGKVASAGSAASEAATAAETLSTAGKVASAGSALATKACGFLGAVDVVFGTKDVISGAMQLHDAKNSAKRRAAAEKMGHGALNAVSGGLAVASAVCASTGVGAPVAAVLGAASLGVKAVDLAWQNRHEIAGVARKVGHVVANGARKLEHVVANGARKVEHLVADGARKVEHLVANGARKVEHVVANGARKLEHAFRFLADKFNI